MSPCPKQPCYPWAHTHYPDWLRETVITERCKCGQHPRTWTVGALMAVWAARP